MEDEIVSTETDAGTQDVSAETGSVEVTTPEGAAEAVNDAAQEGAENTDTTVTEENEAAEAESTKTAGEEQEAKTEESESEDGDDETTIVVEEEEAEEEFDASKFESKEDAVAYARKANRDAAAKRVENKELRAQLEEIETAFEGGDEDFKTGWLQIGRLLLEDPEAAKAILADVVGGEPVDEAPAKSPEQLVNEVFERREAQLSAQAQAAALHSEVTEMGYKPDAKADDSADADPVAYAKHALLWNFVKSQPEGQRDLKAAHESVEKFEQAILDNKLNELKSASKDAPPVLVGGGGTGSTELEAKTAPVAARDVMKEAEEKSIRFYEERQG